MSKVQVAVQNKRIYQILKTAFFLGFTNYCERYNKTIYDVSMTMGPVPRFTGPQINEINSQLEEMVPLSTLPARRAWRDMCLIKLSELKKRTKSE